MAVITPGPKPAQHPARPEPLPPLENGDRLTRDEFERRYDAMPRLKKAELIEGEVHVASAVRYKGHSKPNAYLLGWLVSYASATPGTEPGDNGSIRLDLENEPQPDGFLMISPERGGHARISDDDYVEGAPELIAEIASCSVSYDFGKKKNVYRRNQVQEYIVWRVLDREIDWFVLRGGVYEPLLPFADGILTSTVFPGLWLDPAAIIRGDIATALAVLQRGLNSPEHAVFCARLAGSETRE
jgi:Uma2 family endonuclease